VNDRLEETLKERDFFRALAGLARCESLDLLLRDALATLLKRVNAREVVIELMGDEEGTSSRCVAAGCDGGRLAEVSRLISRGIIGEAVATGTTVLTASARSDPRFHEFESVQRHGLEAVLCTPIGRDIPLGVIYLQGHADGGDFRPFDDALRDDVELFALALSAPAERLMRLEGTPIERWPHGGAETSQDPFGTVLGRSRAMRDVVARLRLAAPLDVHVLLTGQSGSGKTLLASAIHQASPRRAKPFVEINCATLPEALLENELFGAEAGAHSAVPKSGLRGKLDAAEGGTLFLDEIAELTLGAQAKLLQLLQSRAYHRLGGTKLHHADVRVIAATNLDLKAAVAEKRFREDLYYRLLVFEARVPSLSERTSDLSLLAAEFLRQAVERHRLARKTFSPSALHAITTAPWPGNVRELANRIESATIHAHVRGSESIEVRDVFPDVTPAEVAPSLQAATRRFQSKHVLAMLESTDWNVPETARLLDVSRSQAYALIRAFELKRT
jgi:Nif-specific regulatory protein